MANTTTVPPVPLRQGEIPETTFRIVTATTFVLALLAISHRLYILVSRQRSLSLDDILLIFAIIFLISSTIILLVNLDNLYLADLLVLNGPSGFSASDLQNWLGRQDSFQRMNFAYLAISWASIFFVKFSFLSFFSGLCDRLPKMELYRKIVYIITFPIFVYSSANAIISCPYVGMAAQQCVTPAALQKEYDIQYLLGSLDVATDVLILIIPITLLWKVNLKTSQKLMMSLFLCLNLVMIIIAIIRISGFNYYTRTDVLWTFLWQQIEASVAVTMISLTAFRFVFISNRSSMRSRYHNPWSASIPNFLKRRRNCSPSSHDVHLRETTTRGGIVVEVQTAIGNSENDSTFVEPSVTTDCSVHDGLPLRLPEKALTREEIGSF